MKLEFTLQIGNVKITCSVRISGIIMVGRMDERAVQFDKRPSERPSERPSKRPSTSTLFTSEEDLFLRRCGGLIYGESADLFQLPMKKNGILPQALEPYLGFYQTSKPFQNEWRSHEI